MRGQRVADEVAADEAGAAGDEDFIGSPPDADLGVVAEHEAVGARLHRLAIDPHVLADQAVLDAVGQVAAATTPSSTMLCSISVSWISTSFMIDVNGPT